MRKNVLHLCRQHISIDKVLRDERVSLYGALCGTGITAERLCRLHDAASWPTDCTGLAMQSTTSVETSIDAATAVGRLVLSLSRDDSYTPRADDCGPLGSATSSVTNGIALLCR